VKLTLGIGETKKVSVAGGRFYFEKGDGRIAVKTLGNDASEFDLSPGMGFQNGQGKINFPELEIVNKHSAAQTIEFVISYRELFDNRVTFGDEALVKSRGSDDATDKGKAFSRSVSVAAAASNYSAVSLVNRQIGGAARFYVYVRRIVISGSGTFDFEVFLMADYFTSSFQTYVVNEVQAAFKGNHLVGGLPSKATLYAKKATVFTEASLSATDAKVFCGTVDKSTVVIEFKNAIKLSPLTAGAEMAVMVRSLLVNAGMSVTFEVEEIFE
jgi:hypothetical protein